MNYCSMPNLGTFVTIFLKERCKLRLKKGRAVRPAPLKAFFALPLLFFPVRLYAIVFVNVFRIAMIGHVGHSKGR